MYQASGYHVSGNAVAAQPAEEPSRLSPALRISTREMPERMQSEAWHGLGGSPFEFEPVSAGARFEVEHTTWDLGGVALSRTIFPALTYARTSRRVREDSIDHWFLTAPRRGEVRSLGAGRAAKTIPGTLKIQSLKGAFEGQTTAMDIVHLFVPRDFCRDEVAALDAADNTVIGSALGHLLADYLINLEHLLPLMKSDELPALLTTLRAMILACVAPNPDTLDEARATIDATFLERARQLIQRRLFSPTLGADELCRELGVSRSRLYRMFEPHGGVVHYIRQRRLLDAHAALSRTADRRTIVEIAAERGFMDAAEFSRAFKREFGYRPTDARTHANVWPIRRHESQAHTRDGEEGLAKILLRLQ
jgi:AraC-like DNA-binding protein